MPIQQRNGIQALWLGNPTRPPRGHSSETPADVIAAPHLRLLRYQEPQKRASDVSKTDDGKIVERNISLCLKENLPDRCVQFFCNGVNVRGFRFQNLRRHRDTRLSFFPLL